MQKKVIIDSLPHKLQKNLIKHLYGPAISQVPVFAYMDSVDDSQFADLLKNVFFLVEYSTFAPGEIIVNFWEEADRLLFFVSGKVAILTPLCVGLSACLSACQRAVCQNSCINSDWTRKKTTCARAGGGGLRAQHDTAAANDTERQRVHRRHGDSRRERLGELHVLSFPAGQ